MSGRLADLRWPEVDAVRPLLIVPLGSTEQHGPHLPLDTDTRIAVHVAEALADALTASATSARTAAVVAPAVAIGASGEHAGFPGTLSVGAAVFEEMVVEIGRSADAFAGLVWVNAHGGNGAALRSANDRLMAEGRRSLVVTCGVPGGDAHAGATETSMMLAIAPEAVRMDLAASGATAPWDELRDRVVAGGVGAVSPNGVLGDPTGASGGAGSELLAELVARAVSSVARWIDDEPS